MSRFVRAAVAALAIVAIVAAGAVAFQLGTQLAITPPGPETSDAPTLTPSSLGPGAAPTIGESRTPQPSTSCRVLRTPEPNSPTHGPVNGQPSLGVPIQSGVILVEIAQCRDIQAILVKYDLLGPANAIHRRARV